MSFFTSIVLICIFCTRWMACSTATSSYFVPYNSGNDITGAENARLINKIFHKCSIEESCGYVFQDRATSQYEMSGREEDLPQSKEKFKIWRKMWIKNQPKKERQAKEIKTCKEALDNGTVTDGIVELSLGNGSSFNAYCDMTTDGGGWTIFQRRVDGSVSFDRNWDEYVRGFGDLTGDFWLGLEIIHHLTKRGSTTLRFDLLNIANSSGYAKYSEFKLKNRAANYEISLGAYNGNIGDGMSMSNGMGFSTRDKDNDYYAGGNCATLFQGAWWYNQCSYVRLNSPFPGRNDYASSKVMKWTTWNEGNGTIKYSEVKLRENQ